MRPVEFSAEAIVQAGKDLQSASRKVTGFALRQKVGGGNPSRLRQVWDEYLASQTETGADPAAELPVEVAERMAAVTKELIDHLSALAIDVNDKAVKAAERRTRDLVRAAGEQRSQAESELIDAGQAVDDLEQQLDKAQADSDELKKQLAEAQGTNQAQAVQLAQVRERLSLAEQSAKTATSQHAAELARMNVSIDSDRATHHQELKQLRAELAEQEQETQALAAELATANARVAAATETHQEQRQEIAQLRTDCATEGKARTRAEQQAAVLTEKLQDAARRIADTQTRANKFEKLAEETTTKLTNMHIAMEAERARLAAAVAELADAKQATAEARASAKKAGEEAAELRGKYAAALAPEATKSPKPPPAAP